jgi:hypothetical protein
LNWQEYCKLQWKVNLQLVRFLQCKMQTTESHTFKHTYTHKSDTCMRNIHPTPHTGHQWQQNHIRLIRANKTKSENKHQVWNIQALKTDPKRLQIRKHNFWCTTNEAK